MNVVIAIDSFKGSLSSLEAGESAANGLNNPARRVGRGFRCSRQDFSHWDALEPRFSPELRFS